MNEFFNDAASRGMKSLEKKFGEKRERGVDGWKKGRMKSGGAGREGRRGEDGVSSRQLESYLTWRI